MKMPFAGSPFVRGFLGALAALLLVGLAYTAYQDHKAIQILVQVVSQWQQQAQQAPAGS